MHIQPKCTFEFRSQTNGPSSLFERPSLNHNSENYSNNRQPLFNANAGQVSKFRLGALSEAVSNNPFELSQDMMHPFPRQLHGTFSDPQDHQHQSSLVPHPFPALMRHHSNGEQDDQLMPNIYQRCRSPLRASRFSINRRLFEDTTTQDNDDDDETVSIPQRRPREDVFRISSRQDFVETTTAHSSSMLSSDVYFGSGQLQSSSNGEDSYPEDYDVDEFNSDEPQPQVIPIDQLLRMRGRNEFVYDPENGGGRRRRNKKVSRIELLNLDKPAHQPPKLKVKSNQLPRQELMPSAGNTPQPEQGPDHVIRVDPSLYQLDSLAKCLTLIEEPRNIGKNSITHSTLANFLQGQSAPFLIVDCRFNYEYNGGHIRNAININDPKQMQALFFKDRQTVERLMKTIVVFHCEFSQKRGPAMYQALRELDRRLHLHCYPQLFFTEIYILEGGYKQFHESQPQLCDGGYVPMADKVFKEDCKEKFHAHKALYKEFEQHKKDPFLISQRESLPFQAGEASNEE